MRILAPALADYMEAFPEVEVELSFSNRVVDFVEEGFDVRFRVADLADSGLVARPLAPYRLVLCASTERYGRWFGGNASALRVSSGSPG